MRRRRSEAPAGQTGAQADSAATKQTVSVSAILPPITDTSVTNGATTNVAAIDPLRALLESTAAEREVPLGQLTVLSAGNDPFRMTDAARRDANWLQDQMRQLVPYGSRHIRALHYMLIGRPKPDGLPYTNTERDWVWLSKAVGSARYLGVIGFDRITDNRNDPPEVREASRRLPMGAWATTYFEVTLPDPDDLRPRVHAWGAVPQPFRIIFVGEKSSLKEPMARIVSRFNADEYWPTGEMSITMAHHMAQSIAQDGRPAQVFYLADCDPSGWQMPISLCRKLQALRATSFPEIDVKVHRVALTPDQVREYGLPSTPLKESERRGDKWQEAMGVAQTEIDALAALQPQLLRQVVLASVSPFWDDTLATRTSSLAMEYQEQVREVVESDLNSERRDNLHAQAREKLAEIQAQLDELQEEAKFDLDDFDLPDPPALPEPELDESAQPEPLFDSSWDFGDQCEALIYDKSYGGAS